MDRERDLVYHWIAGTFALLCCVIALGGIVAHARALARPEVQRKILALLWMPPIYALCCWCSLLFPPYAPLLAVGRDAYEAYAIWVFVRGRRPVLFERPSSRRGCGDVASMAWTLRAIEQTRVWRHRVDGIEPPRANAVTAKSTT